jgi:hypothetical protein
MTPNVTQIRLCDTTMTLKYESGNNYVFSWYHEKREFLYMKPKHEVEELIKSTPNVVLTEEKV